MTILVSLAALTLAVWAITKAANSNRHTTRAGEEARVDVLIDALYRDGVKVGYQSALTRQVVTEGHRVRLYVRRRNQVMLAVLAAGAAAAAFPVAGALGVLPGQAEWAAAVPVWQWLALVLGVAVVAVMAVLLLMPRDYARFFTTPRAHAAALDAAEGDIETAVNSRLSSHLETTKAYLTRMTNERYAAGVEQGRRQALSAGSGRAVDDADLQARVSSAANAAYVQGRRDGVKEAQSLRNQQLSDAYRRGVSDGERLLVGGLEGRLRAERELGYQSGYRAGVQEGRANAAQAATGKAAVRPRSRSEALKLLDLVEGSSQSDIEKRYRELRASVHPDAIRSKKLPRAMVEFAEEHFKLIGEAYDILRR
mgnify:FL=1